MLFFTLICTIPGIIISAVLSSWIPAAITVGVGFVADCICWVIGAIKDRDEPSRGFGIDWGA